MLAVPDIEQLPVAEARGGDPGAWDTLFRRYQLPLYTYIYEWVHDEQTALDLVQEAFIRAVRHLGTLREDSKFGSWLFGIAHQQAAQHWRKRQRQLAALDDLEGDLPDGPEEPDEWLLRQEQQACFLAALQRLPPPQRSVLVLHFLEDFSLEDIAAITGIPRGTVKSRLHYAKQSLRRILEEDPS
jgi:RNA polymerase sigma-70 factor (ECF subfamily)